MIKLEDHLNLVRKIVWGYVAGNDSSVEFDDLFSESCLTCLEATDKYNPDKAKESTYIYHVVNNKMRSMLRDRISEGERYAFMTEEQIDMIADPISPEMDLMAKESWIRLWKSLSPEAKEVCAILFHEESEQSVDKPRLYRGEIARKLESRGWSQNKIWKTFREIKKIVNEN